jgi:hypothetical protein
MALTKVKSSMLDTGIADNSTDTAMTIHSSGDITLASTGSIVVPVGTTAQRPANTAGSLRYNSTTGGFEGYSTEWGSIGGSIDATHGSLTPTLSSTENNKIVISNYSSYSNPTVSVFLGTASLPFAQEGANLTITDFSTTGSQTVSVRVSHGGGSIFGAETDVTVNIVDPAARYWRFADIVSGALGLRLGHFRVYSELNGGGTGPTSSTWYTASRNNGSWYPYHAYSTALGNNWYNDSPVTGTTDWIMIDMQSAVEVNSVKVGFQGNATYFGANKLVLQSSNDNSTWTEVAIFGTGGVTGSSAVLVSARTVIQTFNRTSEWN